MISNYKSHVIIARPKNGCTARSAAAAAVFIRMGNKGPRAAAIDEDKLSYFGAAAGLPIDIMQAQADKWLSAILEHLMRHPEHREQYITPIKMLLGTLMYWYDNGWCRDKPLTILKDPAMIALANHAKIAETYYHRHHIADKLGSLGKRAGWSARPRMDDKRVLGTHLWTSLSADEDGIWALMCLSCAVDAGYQAVSKRIAEATGGSIRHAPIKGWARMVNKLNRNLEHESIPREACNIDMCRNAVTYKTCEALKAGYKAFKKRFSIVSVTNNFRKTYDALETSFGYRSCLVSNRVCVYVCVYACAWMCVHVCKVRICAYIFASTVFAPPISTSCA